MIEEMHNYCYETLIDYVKTKENVPFNTNNIRESVMFDLFECKTIDEMDEVIDMAYDGKTFNEIEKAIQE